MEQIALIYGSLHIYWSAVLTAMAGAAAVCVYLSLMFSDAKGREAVASVPLAVLLSLVLGRFVHWYCRADQYAGLAAAMTDYSSGSYALAGVFAGCMLAAVLVRLLGLTRDLPRMLDCMSIAGCAGMAVGRLACFFNGQDRGMIVTMLNSLPWAYPVTNPVSGVEELRLATFFLQAVVAAVLFLVLLAFRLAGRRILPDGDICLIFLLCYGASQVILDSTRYDSLYFRSNGFVSIVQVLGACGIALAAVAFSVRLVRQQGWKRRYCILWVLLLGVIGLAGFMEYFVQRWSRKLVFGYSVMAAALLMAVTLILVIRHLAGLPKQKGDSGDGRYDSESKHISGDPAAG